MADKEAATKTKVEPRPEAKAEARPKAKAKSKPKPEAGLEAKPKPRRLSNGRRKYIRRKKQAARKPNADLQ